MRYPAKELKAEAYKAYSKDAFNDEERGVAYYLHNCRYKLTAGEIDKFDDIQCVPIDAMHYIDTALPGNDIIILTAADNSDKKIPMSLVDWFWTIDRNLIEWYNVGNKQSSGEYKVSVPSRLYEKWANYLKSLNLSPLLPPLTPESVTFMKDALDTSDRSGIDDIGETFLFFARRLLGNGEIQMHPYASVYSEDSQTTSDPIAYVNGTTVSLNQTAYKLIADRLPQSSPLVLKALSEIGALAGARTNQSTFRTKIQVIDPSGCHQRISVVRLNRELLEEPGVPLPF